MSIFTRCRNYKYSSEFSHFCNFHFISNYIIDPQISICQKPYISMYLISDRLKSIIPYYYTRIVSEAVVIPQASIHNRILYTKQYINKTCK